MPAFGGSDAFNSLHTKSNFLEGLKDGIYEKFSEAANRVQTNASKNCFLNPGTRDLFLRQV